MLWVPEKRGRTVIVTNAGIVGTATPGTALPENATTLLDGAVTEIISAAANVYNSWGIEIFIWGTGASATASECAVDILIGGATDDVLIAALLCGNQTIALGGCSYFFPIHIPAGVRIAAQLASVRTVITDPRIEIRLYSGGTPPFRVGRKVTTYGTQINNARGKAVVPTASGGAASVTEMTASTTEDHFYFLPGFQPATDITITPAGYLSIGIGVGAATEDRIGTWWYSKDTTESVSGPIPNRGVYYEVPAGSRLSLLASNSGTNDAAYDGLIYAVS